MTGLAVIVPSGFRIVGARPTGNWKPALETSTVTWRGGPLPHLDLETFVLDVEVSADPGPVTLVSRQLYPSGAAVRWPATLTVVTGDEEPPRQHLGRGLAVGALGIVTLALGVVAWHQRTRARRSG
jgi:hypothetical protein